MSSGITNMCFPPANTCANCHRKGHDQRLARDGSNGKEYKRCTGCRLMTYCDQDCQREHWLRVHNQHCRFLEGRKQVENNEHNPQTCTLCAEARNSSDEEITSSNSPKVFCYLQQAITRMKKGIANAFKFHAEGKTCACPSTTPWPGHLPLSFGEISGHYAGGVTDEMLSHMLKLVVAIQVKDENIKQETGGLIPKINQARLKIWVQLLVFGRQLHTIEKLNKDMISAIDSLKEYLGTRSPWWISLKFSHDLQVNIEDYSFLPVAIKTDFIEKSNDQRFNRLKQVLKDDESQYKNIDFAFTNNFLSRFKVWPKLVENSLVVLLPSDLHCQTCQDKLDGQFSLKDDETLLRKLYPLWLPSIGEGGSCEVYCSLRTKPKCVGEGLKKSLGIDRHKVYAEDFKLFVKKSRMCDECGKLSLYSHRCTACHAAQYCSTHCQGENFELHKTVCAKWAKDESRSLGSAREQKNFLKTFLDE